MNRFALRYIPGTKDGDKFPTWRFGFRPTREACEAIIERGGLSPDRVEVVEVEA